MGNENQGQTISAVGINSILESFSSLPRSQLSSTDLEKFRKICEHCSDKLSREGRILTLADNAVNDDILACVSQLKQLTYLTLRSFPISSSSVASKHGKNNNKDGGEQHFHFEATSTKNREKYQVIEFAPTYTTDDADRVSLLSPSDTGSAVSSSSSPISTLSPTSIVHSLAAHPSLTRLDFINNPNIDDSWMQCICDGLPQLQRLNLWGSEKVTLAGFKCLAKNHKNQLIGLDISCMMVVDEDWLKWAAMNLVALQVFSFRGCPNVKSLNALSATSSAKEGKDFLYRIYLYSQDQICSKSKRELVRMKAHRGISMEIIYDALVYKK